MEEELESREKSVYMSELGGEVEALALGKSERRLDWKILKSNMVPGIETSYRGLGLLQSRKSALLEKTQRSVVIPLSISPGPRHSSIC